MKDDCIMIAPGSYTDVWWESEHQCFVTMGNIKLTNCKFNGKFYVVGNLIAHSTKFVELDVGGFTCLKDSNCEKNICSFLGANLFRSTSRKLLTYGKTYLKNVKIDDTIVSGTLQIRGECELQRVHQNN